MSQYVDLLFNPNLVEQVVNYRNNDPDRMQGVYFGLNDENYGFLLSVAETEKEIINSEWKKDADGGIELGQVLEHLHKKLIDAWVTQHGKLPLCVLMAITHIIAVEIVHSQLAEHQIQTQPPAKLHRLKPSKKRKK